MTPDFGVLWDGPWPYDHQAGVGIEMKGRPHGAERFILTLAEYGCHPAAGRRIFDTLATQGIDTRTVTRAVNFIKLNNALIAQGVTLRIVAPKAEWTPTIIDGAWPQETLTAIGH